MQDGRRKWLIVYPKGINDWSWTLEMDCQGSILWVLPPTPSHGRTYPLLTSSWVSFKTKEPTHFPWSLGTLRGLVIDQIDKPENSKEEEVGGSSLYSLLEQTGKSLHTDSWWVQEREQVSQAGVDWTGFDRGVRRGDENSADYAEGGGLLSDQLEEMDSSVSFMQERNPQEREGAERPPATRRRCPKGVTFKQPLRPGDIDASSQQC